MQQALLDHLRKITEEEQRILDGVAEVDKDLYTSGCLTASSLQYNCDNTGYVY